MKYKVLIGCENDKKKKRYEPGETIEDGNFPGKVIKNWIEIGVLAPIIEEKKNGERQTTSLG